jgi:hypothetical protein
VLSTFLLVLQDGGQEIDYQLEYATKSIRAGVYLIDFAPLEWTRYKGSATMPYIKMYADQLNLFDGCTASPHMELDYIASFDNHGFDGIMALANLDYAYQSRSINHEGKLHLVYDAGIFGFQKGFVFLPEVNLKWRIGDVLVKLPIVKAAIPISPISDRLFHALVGVGASYDIKL